MLPWRGASRPRSTRARRAARARGLRHADVFAARRAVRPIRKTVASALPATATAAAGGRSEPSVDEYGRPVMQQQTRAPSYAPPPRRDYEPQARRYVPPAPPPAPPPYAHSMRGSLGSAPYSRPAAPAPAPPPPPVVEEAGTSSPAGRAARRCRSEGPSRARSSRAPSAGR